MSNTMRAAIVRRFGAPLTIEETAIPEPRYGEVLVRILACGVCHTDLHAADGDWPIQPSLPFIPGHEGIGLVAACGPGVTRLREGDLVGLPWLHDACGACEHCVSGWETVCESQHNTGYGVNGAFADYAIGNAAYVVPLPSGTDEIRMAPILCAGVTTYKGIKETEAKPGEWLAIVGIGGLGHVGIQYAKAMGLQVAALDVGADKLALATSMGADVAVDATDPEAAAHVARATGGGAHGVLVTAASLPAFAQAFNLVRRRGTISVVGLPPGAFPTPVFDVVLKRITVRGSIVGTRKDLAEAVEFAVANKVTTHTHTARLEEVNRVFDDLRAGRVDGRVVLDMTDRR